MKKNYKIRRNDTYYKLYVLFYKYSYNHSCIFFLNKFIFFNMLIDRVLYKKKANDV